MAITLTEARANLAAYQKADLEAVDGKVTEWAARRFETHSLKDIREGIEYWERKVKQLERKAAGCDGSQSFAATARLD